MSSFEGAKPLTKQRSRMYIKKDTSVISAEAGIQMKLYVNNMDPCLRRDDNVI